MKILLLKGADVYAERFEKRKNLNRDHEFRQWEVCLDQQSIEPAIRHKFMSCMRVKVNKNKEKAV